MSIFNQSRYTDPLTERESDILHLIARGLSNREIAQQLSLSHETVKWYNKRIYTKLAVSSRTQAVAKAQQAGLLEDGHAAPQDAPPAPAQPAPPRSQHLPAPITSFVGRAREVTEATQLLERVRLLTLSGPGGTGKSRLGLEVATQVADRFPDGVFFVALTPLTDPALVPRAIANALAINEAPTEPLIETLARTLKPRTALLLLDNFEHVLEGAQIVPDLLSAAPQLKILATSREPLHVSGEQVYPVPPLELPDESHDQPLEDLLASEAVTLFVQRARAVKPDFRITPENAADIAELCIQLDGLPLAIELAATRIKLLTPRALRELMDAHHFRALNSGPRDVPARQQTLLATLEWSYNLLDEREKTLFRRVGVFRNGRSLEAIEAVCSAGLDASTLDILASLVDKSMIQHTEDASGKPRFMMLDTLHEYARERLAESGEANAIAHRHAEYFTALAERAAPELRHSDQYRWLQQLEIEHDNLRAALEWTLGGGDPVLGVRLAGALKLYWNAQGYHSEGLQWTRRALAHLDAAPAEYHASLQISAGIFLWYSRDYEAARSVFEDAVATSRRLDDKPSIAWAQVYLSYCIWLMGETERGMALAESALALFRDLDDKPGLAQAINLVGELARLSGEPERAREAYEQCLALSREIGEHRRVIMMLASMAYLAQHDDDHTQAKALLQESLHLARAHNDRYQMAAVLAVLAGSICCMGEPERAARLFSAADHAREQMGALWQPGDAPEIERNLASIRARLEPGEFDSAWAAGRKQSLDDALDDALRDYTG